jgi:hypothetical protein
MHASLIILLLLVITACAPKDEKRESMATMPINSLNSAVIDFQKAGGVELADVRYMGCMSARGEVTAKPGNQLAYIHFTSQLGSGQSSTDENPLREDEFLTYIRENTFLMYNKNGTFGDVMQISDRDNILSYPLKIDIQKHPFLNDYYDFEVIFETSEDPKIFTFNMVRADRIDQTLIACQE